VAVRLW